MGENALYFVGLHAPLAVLQKSRTMTLPRRPSSVYGPRFSHVATSSGGGVGRGCRGGSEGGAFVCEAAWTGAFGFRAASPASPC